MNIYNMGIHNMSIFYVEALIKCAWHCQKGVQVFHLWYKTCVCVFFSLNLLLLKSVPKGFWFFANVFSYSYVLHISHCCLSCTLWRCPTPLQFTSVNNQVTERQGGKIVVALFSLLFCNCHETTKPQNPG